MYICIYLMQLTNIKYWLLLMYLQKTSYWVISVILSVIILNVIVLKKI